MEDGIFASLRKKQINLLDDSFVNISASHDFWKKETGSSYCGIESIIGGPPNVVVDGRNDTAYASLEKETKENRYITFDFKKNKVRIESFAIQTLCDPPKHLIVEGSFESSAKWYTILDITTPLEDMKVNSFQCSQPQTFTIIRFRQIGPCSDNNYRFHAHNIEIYGKLHMAQHALSCRKQISSHLPSLLFAFFEKS